MAAPYNLWTMNTTSDPGWPISLTTYPQEWADNINLRVEDGIVKTDMFTPQRSGSASIPSITLSPETWQEPFNGISEDIFERIRVVLHAIVRVYMDEEQRSPLTPSGWPLNYTSSGWQGDHWLWEGNGTYEEYQSYVSIPSILLRPVYENIGPQVRVEVEYYATEILPPPPVYGYLYTELRGSDDGECLEPPIPATSIDVNSIKLYLFETDSWEWEHLSGICTSGTEVELDMEPVETVDIPTDYLVVDVYSDWGYTEIYIQNIMLPSEYTSYDIQSKLLYVLDCTAQLSDGRTGPLVIHATPGGE